MNFKGSHLLFGDLSVFLWCNDVFRSDGSSPQVALNNGALPLIAQEEGAGLSVDLGSAQFESGRTTGMVITAVRVVVNVWRMCPCVKPFGFWLR